MTSIVEHKVYDWEQASTVLSDTLDGEQYTFGTGNTYHHKYAVFYLSGIDGTGYEVWSTYSNGTLNTRIRIIVIVARPK